MTARVVAVLAAGALLVVTLVGVGIARLSESGEPARVPAAPASSLAPGAESADDFAGAACVRLSLAVQGVRADSGADVVRRELAAARVLAAEAVRREGTYAPLSGGIAALDEAVRRDDGAAAAQAVRVALDACRQASLPAGPASQQG